MDRGGHPLVVRLSRSWSDFLGLPLVRFVVSHWHHRYGLLAIAIVSALVVAKFIEMPGKAPDFTVFWAAATHASGPVYNSDFITPLQNGPPGPRPFNNPPTFLLMLLPIGLLSFKAAYVAWVAASVAAYFAVGLRMTNWAWLALFSPTLIFVALTGQTTLLAGGLTVLGLWLGGRSSTVAGVALGVAACIKPQLVILAPLALLLQREFHAFMIAVLTASIMALATTLVFGFEIWSAWVKGLAAFSATTTYLKISLLPLPRQLPILLLGSVIVLALMVFAARNRDRPRMIISTIAGSLLLAPYAAHYESVVLLLPALALLRLDWRILPIGVLLFGGAITLIPFAAVTFLLSLPKTSREDPAPLAVS